MVNPIEQRRERWLAIYEAADALDEDWTIKPVTEEFAQQVLDHLGWTYAGSAMNTPDNVRAILLDPETYSPYVDEIAIERALGFDWPVIRRLTTLERSRFLDRLAARPDWQGAIDADQGAIGRGHDRALPERFAQWLRGTASERESIRRSVQRRLADRRK